MTQALIVYKKQKSKLKTLENDLEINNDLEKLNSNTDLENK